MLKKGELVEYANAAQFNLEELKSFISGLDAVSTTVYGCNGKDGYHRLRNELNDITSLNQFSLDKVPYYTAKYALVKGIGHNLQYIEELSPRYVYSDGPF